MKELNEVINDREVIIFGTGKVQQVFQDYYPSLSVKCYLDNNKEKQGHIHNGIEIKSPSYVSELNSNKNLIIVASSYYHDISAQLNSFGLEENKSYIDVFEFLPINEVRILLGIHGDMEEEFIISYIQCRKYSMTSVERMYALYKAIEYVCKSEIEGDIVECGVWKGGSSMMSAYSLKQMNGVQRKIYLYDTFEGMSVPTLEDVDYTNNDAVAYWEEQQQEHHNNWCYSPLEEVRNNLLSTGYPQELVRFIKGKVEDTIPDTVPDKIAVLRLDTDWYESTAHELKYLYPRLSKNGVLIIDDYGHWKGAKKAVDEYMMDNKISILLNKIDYSGRIGIKI